MTITQTQNETIITIPNSVNISYIQSYFDYIKAQSIVTKSKSTEKEILNLSESSQSDWWAKNKSRFIK